MIRSSRLVVTIKVAPSIPSTTWPVRAVLHLFLTLSLLLGILFAMSHAGVAQNTGRSADFQAESTKKASFATAERGPKYVPGRVILRFRTGVPMAAEAMTHSKVGARLLRRFRAMPSVRVVELPAGLSVEQALDHYRRDPNIASAEPDTFVHVLETVPNDPSFSSLWAMKNTGQSGGKADADIDATDAWDLSTGSNSVYVGVIDTGIDYTHPDLSGNIYSSASDCNLNGADDDADGYVDNCHGIDTINHDSYPMDDHSHGSHVSGTIGATGNNASGIVGVSWRVTMIPCKALGSNGTGPTSAVIECLNWFATLKDLGLNIIATNNSWGGDEVSPAMADAIEATMQRGILFVAAAGNGGQDGVGDNNDILPAFPANYDLPNVIAVAATDRNDLPGNFSNFGQHTVHLAAPGVSILSTIPGDSYATFNGTSMATAHVTGAAALLTAQNPSLDWRAIKNLLLSSVDRIGALSANTISGGRLNVYSAMLCSNNSLFLPLLPYRNSTMVTDSTIVFAALNINCARPAGNVTVSIDSGAETLILRDDGTDGDLVAGDGLYTGQWSPTTEGNHLYMFQGGSSGTIRVFAPYSSPTSTTYLYRPITGTNLQLSDEDVISLDLNTSGLFPVTIGGLTFDAISVSANGVLSFNNFSTFTNTPIPTSSAQVLIAPWWDDLSPQSGTDHNIFYQVIGAAPNREFVVEWRDVPQYGAPADVTKTITFQVVFPESSSSSDILFNYADVNFDEQDDENAFNAGGSATVGIQIDPTHGVQYSYNQPLLKNGLALLFQAVSAPPPTPSLTLFAPNGGESWNLGSTQTIEWSYAGPVGTTVKIELLKAGSLQRTLSTSTSTGANGTGSFSWAHIDPSLPSGSDYRIRVSSTSNQAITVSSAATFTLTAPVDSTAPLISGVTAGNISGNGASISWATNEASDSQVEYGTTTAYGNSTTLNPSLVTSHAVALSGLTSGTLYHYRVKSRDVGGNLATSSDFTFTTSDSGAPLISGVTAGNISGSGASISWTTNEASDSQVEYGTMTAYGSSSTLNPSLVTSHAVALSGLTSGTLYHYRVKSRDAAGNLATSSDYTFTINDSAAPMVAITAPASGSTVSGASVTVSANADDNVGVVEVQFKLDGTNLGEEITSAPYSLNWNTTTVTNGIHSLAVTARDAAGNIAVSIATTVTISNSTEFTISVPNGSSNSATTIAGGTATFNFNVSPTTGFAGTVSLSCTGMPQGATCTVSPNPATVSGLSATGVTVTVTTTARSAAHSSVSAALHTSNLPGFATLSLSMLPGMVVILQGLGRRRTRWLVAVAAYVLLVVLVGCGGGGGNSSPTPDPPTQTGTPAGIYTISVSGTAGSVTHSFNLKLTVT